MKKKTLSVLLAMAMAVYMLGFSTYQGFAEQIGQKIGVGKDTLLKQLYEYAKKCSLRENLF